LKRSSGDTISIGARRGRNFVVARRSIKIKGKGNNRDGENKGRRKEGRNTEEH